MHLSRMTKMRPEMQFRDAALGILSPKFSWFIVPDDEKFSGDARASEKCDHRG